MSTTPTTFRSPKPASSLAASAGPSTAMPSPGMAASRPPSFGVRTRAPADEVALFRVMIEQRLRETLPQETAHGARLVRAMRHATLLPGKRIRPLLVVLTARQCGGPVPAALDMGCALEFVHSASLILDDLPCMDDASLRRGQPATHRVFGEDIAILAAIGLLNQAYALVAESIALPDLLRLPLTSLLARTIGPSGLIAGQECDLHERAGVTDFDAMTLFNRLKTGVLIEASVQAGAMIAGAGPTSRAALGLFARQLGEAFQLIDDILDGTGSIDILGKDVGQDAGRPVPDGMKDRDGALALVRKRLDMACHALAGAPCGAEPLGSYARSILQPLTGEDSGTASHAAATRPGETLRSTEASG